MAVVLSCIYVVNYLLFANTFTTQIGTKAHMDSKWNGRRDERHVANEKYEINKTVLATSLSSHVTLNYTTIQEEKLQKKRIKRTYFV